MAARKHALLIAVADTPRIRKHPSRDVHRSYRILRGCDADVELVRDLLVRRFGFADDARSVHVLRTREATQAAILAAVDALVQRVGADDVAVVYYSGHGSRMTDPHDRSRWLETIVPHDSSRSPEPNRDIPDLEIDRWVRRLNEKTPHVTLIFDCCHSGWVFRRPFSHAVREVVADPRPAFDGDEIPALFDRPPGREERARLRSGWLPAGRHAVMVAACRGDEDSWEMRLDDGNGFLFHGVLTYHLAGALSDPGRGGRDGTGEAAAMTWRDVLEQVAPRVSAGWPAQHPQVEGEIDRHVFGTAEVRAEPYLPVVAVEDAEVALWGGAAHGLAAGSLWAIRPHGARRHRDDELARVLLESVRAATSWGRVSGGTKEKLRVGQRAFLLERPANPLLAVAIRAGVDERRDLVETLGASPLISVVVPSAADVLVRLLKPRATAGPGDPCFHLGPLAVPTWAVVGRDGRLEAHPRPATGAGLAELAEDLVRLARFRGIARLENPDPESRLRGRVELRILDASGQVAGIDPERGMVVVGEGDLVDFEIENRHDEKVWVSLVELDCDRSVTVMMPRRGSPAFKPGGRELEPGQVLRVGRDHYETAGGLEQRLPQGFPWPADAGAEPEVGVAHLKLLVTSVAANFELLEQAPARFVATHALERLLWLYQSGAGARTVVLPAEAVARDEDWTVVTKALGTRRATGRA